MKNKVYIKKNRDFAVPSFLIVREGGARDIMKLIAAVLMVFDHAAFAGMATAGLHDTIGRAVFPVFAYSLGCFLTSANPDIRKYVLGTAIFGVIAQPAHYFLIGKMPSGLIMADVLFTLLFSAFLGYLLLYKKITPLLKHTGLISLLFFGNLPIPLEYHFTGIVMPIAFAMTLRGEKSGIFYLVWSFIILNAPASEMFTDTWFKIVFLKALFASAGFYAIYKSAPFIAKDFGITKRFLPSRFLYIFYPLHMLALALIKMK